MRKPCDPDEMKLRVSRCFEVLESSRKLKLYEKMLPICCVCKQIRDDGGREPGTGPWMSIDNFVWEKAGIAPHLNLLPALRRGRKKRDGPPLSG